MASCGYSLLVGGPCGPSSFNPANAGCVAIGECSKDVYNHLVYCKISDDIAVTVNLNYYLLEQVGEILLDIANPRERFFIWTFFPGPPSVARFINLSRGVRERIAKGGQISIGPYIFR